MKELLKKYWKPALICIILLLIINFIRDCQVDRIMNKSIKDNLKSQEKIQKLEKKAGDLELKLYDIEKVKDEIIKENELLKGQGPKIVTKVKYIKVDNKKYILKKVFDDREIYWFNYVRKLQTQFDNYIEADKTEKELNRELILNLKTEISELKNANLNLKKANLKLYKKAKGWLYLGWHIGYDVIHGTYSTGPSIFIKGFKIK